MGCDRFVFDRCPASILLRGHRTGCNSGCGCAGMRPISLAVDVTNYVMLETGQPLHAYDRSRLTGPIVVRRARAGEKVRTLDDAVRELDVDDLLITDDSGPIGIAGVMGGASTEIDLATTDIVIEAAHFDPPTIARSRSASQAAERGVSPVRAGRRDASRSCRAAGRRAARRARWRTATPAARWSDPARRRSRSPARGPSGRGGRHADRFARSRRAARRRWAAAKGGRVRVSPRRGVLTRIGPTSSKRWQGCTDTRRSRPSCHRHRDAGSPTNGCVGRVGRPRRVGVRRGAELPFLSPRVYDAMGLPADDPRRLAARWSTRCLTRSRSCVQRCFRGSSHDAPERGSRRRDLCCSRWGWSTGQAGARRLRPARRRPPTHR